MGRKADYSPEAWANVLASNKRWKDAHKGWADALQERRKAERRDPNYTPPKLSPKARKHRQETNAAWRQRNRDHIRAYNAAYRSANKEREYATQVKWLKSNPEKAAAYAAWRKAKGKSSRAEAIWRLAQQAVPRTLPRDVRDDVLSELVVAALERRVPASQIAKHVGKFIAAYYRQFSKFTTVSLDATVPGTEGLRLIDNLDADTEHF